MTSFIFAIICLSLVVVTGYAGQVSLAQLTLAGVAGFLLATMTTEWSIPFPIAPILAALGATVVGVVVGLPAIRVRGLFVAVVTLAMAYAVQAVWFHNSDYVPAEGRDISGPKFFGLDLRSRVGTNYPRIQFCLVVLGVLVIVAVSVALLRRSRLGSAMLAVRANERSAAGAGINVVRVKILAFAIAAFIAGLGGAMLGYKQGNLTFDPFDVLIGIGVFATAYLAGITSVSGGILAGMLAAGGIAYYAATQWLGLGDWYGTITGVGLVLTVVLNPEGIVGPFHVMLEKMRTRRGTAAVPASTPVSIVDAAPSAAPDPALLSIHDVRVAYGGVVAVDDLSFDVAEGSIVALIGPNGAGKTTLLDAISGFAAASGSIRLGDRELGRLKPHQRIRAGLGRTFQQIELYDDMSVRENIAVGLAGSGRKRASHADLERVLQLLDLNEVAERPAGELSQGQRQLVSIARALVGNPRVLLLDEPASGLDTAESGWLGERLRRIRDSGVTILMVDHDMHLVLNLCEQIHVLDFGVLIASGTPASREGRPPRRRGVSGQHPQRTGHGDRMSAQVERVDEAAGSPAPPLFECRELTAGYGRVNIVRPFDLAADAGTVVAILGPNGAGKTTLLSTMCGLLPRQGGTVRLAGQELKSGARPRPRERASSWSPTTARCSRHSACATTSAPRARAEWIRARKCSSSSLRCDIDGSSMRARCRAASNRCSRWPARWCRGRGCSWSTR